MKYTKDVLEFFKSSPVVDIHSLKRFLRSKGASDGYVSVMLNHLLKRGLINRITKGFYSVYNDPTLITYCLKPSYIGLESALSMRELWEQESSVVVITPLKVRVGVRDVFNSNVFVHRLKQEYFFGYDFIDYYNFKIPVSDVEKTLIDLVHFNRFVSKDVLEEIKKIISRKKLKNYLKVYPNRVVSSVKKLLS